MVQTEYKVSGEGRSIVTEETAEFTTSEPTPEPEAEPQPEPVQGVVESSFDQIVGDVPEPVETEPSVHKQRAMRAFEQRRQLKPHA